VKLESVRVQIAQNHSLELLKFVSNSWFQNHEKCDEACEDATKENEDPCAVYELVLLVRAQAIEPAAVSRPDIAKFLDNVHLSLL
jgi:hypothetical protein